MYATKTLRLQKYGPDGSLRYREEVEPNSFCVAWGATIAAQVSNGSVGPIVQFIGGSSDQINANTINLQTNNSGAASGPGVVFGTGTAAFDHQDNDLDSRLTSNVNYTNGTVSFNSTGAESTIEITRSMSNSGFSTISVEEAGFIHEADTNSSGTQQFLSARDVANVSVDVDPNETLQGTYVLTYD